MNYVTYNLKQVCAGARNAFIPASNRVRRDTAGAPARCPVLHERCAESAPVAVWSLRAEDGRLECRWSPQDAEDGRWRACSSFHRSGHGPGRARMARSARLLCA